MVLITIIGLSIGYSAYNQDLMISGEATVYHQTLYPETVYQDTTTLAPGQTRVQSSGRNGCKSTTYKVVRQNGVVVSRTELSSDTYRAMDKIVLRGV